GGGGGLERGMLHRYGFCGCREADLRFACLVCLVRRTYKADFFGSRVGVGVCLGYTCVGAEAFFLGRREMLGL
ncbi:hypothetical protein COCCADRAFT_83408, partial [Bipolaris zeicola 26-R-13]